MANTIACRQVYTFRMEPTELEALELDQTASVARYVYNWGLARCQEYHRQHGQGKPWAELSAELARLKHTELWLGDFDSQMLQQALADLRRAYINCFERRAGFPKFKKKKAARQSFPIPQRIRVENGCVYVPSIGWVRVRQSQAIEFATKSATFKRTAVGNWFVKTDVQVKLRPFYSIGGDYYYRMYFDLDKLPMVLWDGPGPKRAT